MSTGTVSTVAGMSGEKTQTDGPLAQARFAAPSAVALARDQSVYVNDRGVLRRIAPNGAVTSHVFPDRSPILALAAAPHGGVYVALYAAFYHFAPGSGFTLHAGRLHEWGFDDGARLDARFDQMFTMAVDAAGNIYASQPNAHTVRRIAVDGTVSTIGALGQAGQVDGPARAARFEWPRGLAAHPSGGVWVLDNYRILRRIAPDGTVSSPYPSSPDLQSASHIGANARGDLLALHGRGILKILPDGSSVNFAGQPPEMPMTAGTGTLLAVGGVDAAGNVVVRAITESGPVLRKIGPTGQAVPFGAQNDVALALRSEPLVANSRWVPAHMQVDAAGNVIIGAQLVETIFSSTTGTLFGGALFLVTSDGQLSRMTDWPITGASSAPGPMAVDERSVYFVDAMQGDILRWDRASRTQEVVLTHAQYSSHDPDPARPARQPDALALRQGALHMLRRGAIEKLSGGTVQTVVPAGTFQAPTALAAGEDGSLYVADREVVWKVASGGTPQVLAGTRGKFGVRLGDAPGSLAPVSSLAVERGGRLHLLSGDALITAMPR